jgi:hypothetical protein
VILHPNFAVTFCDKEEIGAILALGDDDILWQIEQSIDIVNQKVNDVFLSIEYGVAFN